MYGTRIYGMPRGNIPLKPHDINLIVIASNFIGKY
jgi:hypothetical protein